MLCSMPPTLTIFIEFICEIPILVWFNASVPMSFATRVLQWSSHSFLGEVRVSCRLRSYLMDVKPRIRQYIAQNLLFSDNGFKYDDEASSLEEGIVDSLGVMDLVFFIEETFGVTVRDEELTP